MPPKHTNDPASMGDAELFERLAKYRLKPGFNENDVFGLHAIFLQARISATDGYRIMRGRDKLGPRRRLRLTRAVVMAETGMMRKINGKIVIGEPTRQLPPRLQIDFSRFGPKLEMAEPKLGVADVMPTFKQIFGR